MRWSGRYMGYMWCIALGKNTILSWFNCADSKYTFQRDWAQEMAEGGEDLTSLSLFLSLAVRCVIPIIFLLSSLSSSLIVYKIFFLLVVNCGAGDCAHPASAYSALRSTSGSVCGQLLYTSAFWSKYLHHKSLEISFWVCCKKKWLSFMIGFVHDRLC